MSTETDSEFLDRVQDLWLEPGNNPSYKDELDRLFALARKGAEAEWRPISEAPKDGTFIAWNGYWRGVAQYFEPAYEDDPPWVDEAMAFIEPQPTHWMPLPPPPTQENER